MDSKSKFDLKSDFRKIEDRLKKVIEGGSFHLFSGEKQYTLLPEDLWDALSQGIETTEEGSLIAPNLFVLLVPELHTQNFEENFEFQNAFISTIHEIAEEAGLIFHSTPILRIVPDLVLEPGALKVLASYSHEDISQTMNAQIQPEERALTLPKNAFLIVNGTNIFPLDQEIINIGRRPDNHLVLNDQRVSRLHAQLRVVNSRFVIFDLDSTGGTFVNSQPIKQHMLMAGDVISLSGFPLVYGQDDERGETQELSALG
jgi:hypothetical protein